MVEKVCATGKRALERTSRKSRFERCRDEHHVETGRAEILVVVGSLGMIIIDW